MVFWVYHEIDETKVINHLIAKFQLVKNKKTAYQFINSFIEALSIKEEKYFSLQECENILCKVLRQESLSDKKWSNILFLRLGLFEPKDDCIFMYLITHDKDNGGQIHVEQRLEGSRLKY